MFYPYYFLSFFLLIFLFLLIFSLTETSDSQDSREGRWNNYFSFFHFHPLTNIHLVYRDFHPFFLINLFIIARLVANESFASYRFAFYLRFHRCNEVGVIDFDISKWNCEDLSSYQTIILLLQGKRFNQLRLKPLPTIVYLPYLPNLTRSHHLSCIRNEGCFFLFLQEVGKIITKSIYTVLK